MDVYRRCWLNFLSANLENYSSVAIYGTGNGASTAFDIINKLHFQDKIQHVVDRDGSKHIGEKWAHYTVKKLDQVAGDIDAVVIAAEISRATILQRLNRYKKKTGASFAVLDVFSDTVKSSYSAKEHREYVEYLENRNYYRDDMFVPITDFPYERREADSKVLAWYLPQYHREDVNDKYHGRGFKEWTMSSQALPMFVGHNQPHIPYDVGYYDLLLPESMQRQVELANLYGVYGFCFDYYWFSGARTMERPLELFLNNPQFNIHFCLNWCMENWTVKWYGESATDIIFKWELKEEDAEAFMRDALPFLKDPRYVCVDGKPLLMFYKFLDAPKEQLREFIARIQHISKREGLSGLYIVLSNNPGAATCPQDWGGDAAAEYPTQHLSAFENWFPKGYLNRDYCGALYSMESWIDSKQYLQNGSRELIRAVMTNFDSTARHSTTSLCQIVADSTPALYKEWLQGVMRENKEQGKLDMVFVLAWNEWAEGAHLEPDTRYGYAYLEATKEAMEELRPFDTGYIERQIKRTKESGIKKIQFILHCIESLGDIVAAEPIVRYLKVLEPNCSICWIIRKEYRELVAYNPALDDVVIVNNLLESSLLLKQYAAKPRCIIVDLHHNGRKNAEEDVIEHKNPVNPCINANTYFDYGSLLESFCLVAGMPALKDAPTFHEDDNAVLPDGLPEKYIVFHCKSAEKCKDWPANKWSELSRRLIAEGFSLVELGQEKVVKVRNGAYHNFTHESNLQSIAQIIKHATCFVGVDSAFAHIANCFMIPGVILMGKYKTFSRPMPYTGAYADGKTAHLLYAENDAPAEALTVDDVFDAVVEKLRETR